VPAGFWNNLETKFQERKARIADHQSVARELIKRGAIRKASDSAQLLQETLNTLHAPSASTPALSSGDSNAKKSGPGAESQISSGDWTGGIKPPSADSRSRINQPRCGSSMALTFWRFGCIGGPGFRTHACFRPCKACGRCQSAG
jgi:hypothetical protein